MKKLGLVVSLAILFACGCADRRGDAVRTFVENNPPDHAELQTITGEFPLEAIGDGRFRTNVPVQYRITEDLVTVYDGFKTPEGALVAQRLDAARAWAATRLPDGDALRTAIERAWQQARYGFLLKRIETAAGTTRSALVSLELRPTADGHWLIDQTGNTLELVGVPTAAADIPLEGSATAVRALSETAVTAGGLETMRADWLTEFERRSAVALEALSRKLLTGTVFTGKAEGTEVELVISRGTDIDEEVIVVLRTTGTPQAAARFTGLVASAEDGSASWLGQRAEVISDGGGELANYPELVLRLGNDGLVGREITLPKAESVDLIPEPAP